MLVCRPPIPLLLMRLCRTRERQMLEAIKALCGHHLVNTRFKWLCHTAWWVFYCSLYYYMVICSYIVLMLILTTSRRLCCTLYKKKKNGKPFFFYLVFCAFSILFQFIKPQRSFAKNITKHSIIGTYDGFSIEARTQSTINTMSFKA